MRRGLFLPIFDELANPNLLAELAAEAEAAGWDGVFLWDHLYYRAPTYAVVDPWIALAAMAERTATVALGPMVTPLARRRPQVVARQLAALDQLCGGRTIFGAGVGLDASGGEFSRFGEELDVRRRADMLDESLSLLKALLSGERVQHEGRWFTAQDVQFRPAPANGRLPIWIGARWPNRRPLRRAAAHDGAFIIDIDTPDELRQAVNVIASLRSDTTSAYDVAVRAVGEPDEWEAAGATWWLASFDAFTVTADEVRRVITQRRR